MESSKTGQKASLNVIGIILQGWNAYVRNLVAFIVMHVVFGGIMAACIFPVFIDAARRRGAPPGAPGAEVTGLDWALTYTAVGGLVLTFLMPFLYEGLIRAYLKAAKGQVVSVGDLFSGGKFFANFFIGFLILGVVSWGRSAPHATVPLAVAAVFLLFMFSLTFFVVVDKDVQVFAAMGKSWDMVKANFVPTLMLLLPFAVLSVGLWLIEKIPFTIYAVMPLDYLVVTPFASCALAALYVRLTPQEEPQLGAGAPKQRLPVIGTMTYVVIGILVLAVLGLLLWRWWELHSAKQLLEKWRLETYGTHELSTK